VGSQTRSAVGSKGSLARADRNGPLRVLLIKSRFNDPSISQMGHPLGIMYIAACLRRDFGYDVRIIDMRVTWLDEAGLAREIRGFAPHVVGISAQTAETACMEMIAACAKKVDPGIVVILGGPHATAYSRQAIGFSPIDYVVVGEGEIVTGMLIERIAAGKSADDLEGIVFRRDGGIIGTGRAEHYVCLDDLPLPAYDLVPLREYKKHPRFSRTGRKDYMSLFTSRACPYRCIYCHDIFGKTFRARSPRSLLAEIRYLHDAYGMREFDIFDDIFNFDRARVIEICDRIIESGMKITLAFPNGVRGDLLDLEQLRKLKAAGTLYMAFGVETAAPRIQKMIRKNLDLEKVRRSIEMARLLRIHSHGFFMMGFPGETLEEMKMTADYVLSSKLHTFNLFMAMPFEGTELGRMSRAAGKDVVMDFFQDYYSEKFVNMTDVPDAVINRLRRRLLMRFYAHPVRAYHILRDFPGNKNPLGLARIFLHRMFWKT
jgi:anaerobic magnesium-protoporphyrin IX monomethyl ester cyclase